MSEPIPIKTSKKATSPVWETITKESKALGKLEKARCMHCKKVYDDVPYLATSQAMNAKTQVCYGFCPECGGKLTNISKKEAEEAKQGDKKE